MQKLKAINTQINKQTIDKEVVHAEDHINENGKRVRAVYAYCQEFAEEQEATEFMKSEGWIRQRDRPTRKGLKWWYNCKKCSVKAFLLLKEEDDGFVFYKSNIEHLNFLLFQLALFAFL
jgi:hypothetical protein